MKVLVCASARAEVVMKCIEELSSSAEITVVAPRNIAAGLIEFTGARQIPTVPLKETSFVAGQEMTSLKGTLFDTAIIVSGGLGFAGFHNVIKAIAGLRFRQLLFYNQIGRKEMIQVHTGFGCTLERYTVAFLKTFFDITRPIELFVERIYIQCAELLDL